MHTFVLLPYYPYSTNCFDWIITNYLPCYSKSSIWLRGFPRTQKRATETYSPSVKYPCHVFFFCEGKFDVISWNVEGDLQCVMIITTRKNQIDLTFGQWQVHIDMCMSKDEMSFIWVLFLNSGMWRDMYTRELSSLLNLFWED